MSRQHATPILIDADGGGATPLVPLAMGTSGHQVSEAAIQTLVQAYPGCLPIAEIDPLFAYPVPICTELNTPAGPIDNFLITPSGLPVLVECKLWRNPEGRREVVGQILDYAKELSRWSSSDLQREVSRRLKRQGNALLDLVREAGHDVDEIAFNDALTLNLRRGRFLLLIVGDGIREGVEAIAEYLQAHAGLHFTLGLVEMPIYAAPHGQRLVVPRVLARTTNLTRTVIAVPEGLAVTDDVDGAKPVDEVDDMTLDRVSFWTQFVEGLRFDDPEQPSPKVSRQGYVYIGMPIAGGSCWLTVFRNIRENRVGIFLSYTRNTIGDRVVRRVVEDWPAIEEELGKTVLMHIDNLDRPIVQDSCIFPNLSSAQYRNFAIEWLQRRTNEFVNVLRPRLKAAATSVDKD